MKKSKQNKQPERDGNIPRQVRMPPFLDDWLQRKAAESKLNVTIADEIRKIVLEKYEAEQEQEVA